MILPFLVGFAAGAAVTYYGSPTVADHLSRAAYHSEQILNNQQLLDEEVAKRICEMSYAGTLNQYLAKNMPSFAQNNAYQPNIQR